MKVLKFEIRSFLVIQYQIKKTRTYFFSFGLPRALPWGIFALQGKKFLLPSPGEGTWRFALPRGGHVTICSPLEKSRIVLHDCTRDKPYNFFLFSVNGVVLKYFGSEICLTPKNMNVNLNVNEKLLQGAVSE